MGSSIGKRGRGFSDINVTPLVDVMLVLVIVFMVTAPFMTNNVEIDLPEANSKQKEMKDSKLLITITKEGRVFFGEKEITKNYTYEILNNQKLKTQKEVYIRADENVKYGVVAKVVAATKSAGVTSLNLLLKPEGK